MLATDNVNSITPRTSVLETAAGASDEAVTTKPASYALAPDEFWIPGPYLTIKPESASKPQELAALSELYLNVHF